MCYVIRSILQALHVTYNQNYVYCESYLTKHMPMFYRWKFYWKVNVMRSSQFQNQMITYSIILSHLIN